LQVEAIVTPFIALPLWQFDVKSACITKVIDHLIVKTRNRLRELSSEAQLLFGKKEFKRIKKQLLLVDKNLIYLTERRN
jgi:hypothetical protein